MIERNRCTTWLMVVVLIGLCTGSVSTYALPEDRNRPIHVISKTLEYDRPSGSITYIGDVVITQGTMVLKGDKIIVMQYPEGGIQTIIAKGRPAYFKDIIDAGQPPTIAYGNQMEYQDRDRTLTIEGLAKVLQGEDQFMGYKIRYLLDESKLAAEGGQSHQGKDERIEMIIQPRNIEQ